jgi:soluble lytic murein transglycosylase-like protein
MQRLLSALILLPIALNLTSFALSGQTTNGQSRLSSARPDDMTSLRVEQAVARQRRSVENMAESIASQQRAVGRQRGVSLAAGFFAPSGERVLTRAAPETCDSLPPDQIDALVNSAAKRTSVSPELIRSVMGQESAFRACAVSAKGAVGLMQLVPSTAVDLGVKDIFDPEANVLGGARLLKQLMDRYGGDLKLTLSAYNAGAGRVDAAGGVPMIPETIDYVSRILGKLSSSNPLKSAIENDGNAMKNQFVLDSAADTSLWLTGSDGGK